MVNVKQTVRKSRALTEHGPLGSHPCRFPGCGKRFAFRQNMSRHMKNVHKVSAKSFVDYRLKNVSSDNASPVRFDDEGEIFGAFQRAGATLGTVEGELALNTLSEVADNIPTLYTLGCGSTSHHSAVDPVMIISSTDSDVETDDVDLPASYPAEDQCDTLSQSYRTPHHIRPPDVVEYH